MNRSVFAVWAASLVIFGCTTSFKYDDDRDVSTDTSGDTSGTDTLTDVLHDTDPDGHPDVVTDTDPADTSSEDTVDPYADRDDDGFSPVDGDCDDSDPLVNPDAWDTPADGVDDDCDDVPDNPMMDCDCLEGAPLVAGLDICEPRFLVSAEDVFYMDAAVQGRGLLYSYGAPDNGLGPRAGCGYTVLDTGRIDPVMDGVCDDRQPGTDFYDPDGSGTGGCTGGELDPSPSGPDGTTICDTQQLVLTLRAPSNVVGLSFDFIFVSSEFPEWLDTDFNDTFYAIYQRTDTMERISLISGPDGGEINVGSAFIEDPPETDLGGTGYDEMVTDPTGGTTAPCGTSTGWLRTSWPLEPGEEFTLTFSIHDEGDGIYDSLVMLDRFTWHTEPVEAGTVHL